MGRRRCLSRRKRGACYLDGLCLDESEEAVMFVFIAREIVQTEPFSPQCSEQEQLVGPVAAGPSYAGWNSFCPWIECCIGE